MFLENQNNSEEPFPVVYTTRLEDMTVLKESENNLIAKDNLLDVIEAASKPTFDIKKVSRKRKSTACNDYYLLKNKLNKYCLCKRKKRLQLLSTPKVVLTRFEDIKLIDILKETKQSDNVIVLDDETVIVGSDDDLSAEHIPTRHIHQTIPLKSKPPNSTIDLTKDDHNEYIPGVFKLHRYIVFFTLSSRQTAVYSYNAVKRCYPTFVLKCATINKDKDLKMLRSMFSHEPSLIVNNCCWITLNQAIRKKLNIDLPTVYHKCSQKHCQCCCRGTLCKNDTLDSLIDDTRFIKNKKCSLKELYKLKSVENHNVDYVVQKRQQFNLINMALTFNKPTTLDESKTTPKSDLDGTSLYFINDKRKISEIYSFDLKGSVVGYWRTGGGYSSLSEETTLLSLHWKLARVVTPVNTCCWFQRNNLISKLKEIKCSPEVMNYLHQSHSCTPKCRCCCLKLTLYQAGNPKYDQSANKALNQYANSAQLKRFDREVKHLRIFEALNVGKLKILKSPLVLTGPSVDNRPIKLLKSHQTKHNIEKDPLMVKTPLNISLKEAELNSATTNITFTQNTHNILKNSRSHKNKRMKAIESNQSKHIEKEPLIVKTPRNISLPEAELNSAKTNITFTQNTPNILKNSRSHKNKLMKAIKSSQSKHIEKEPLMVKTPRNISLPEAELNSAKSNITLTQNTQNVLKTNPAPKNKPRKAIKSKRKNVETECVMAKPPLNKSFPEAELNSPKNNITIIQSKPNIATNIPGPNLNNPNNTSSINNLIGVQQSISSSNFLGITPPISAVNNNSSTPQPNTNILFVPDSVMPGISVNIKNTNTIVKRAINEIPEAKTSASAIFKTFKDIVLTLDRNGKVAAGLRVPVTTLSPLELKVLSIILCKAQEDVIRSGTVPDQGLSKLTAEDALRKPLTKEDKRNQQRMDLFKNLYRSSFSKSQLYKKCLKVHTKKAKYNLNDKVRTKDTGSTGPIIHNYFSLQQNQDLGISQSIDSVVPIAGPSVVQTSDSKEDLEEQIQYSVINTQNEPLNGAVLMLPPQNNIPLPIVGGLILPQSVPSNLPDILKAAFIPNADHLGNVGHLQDNDNTPLFVGTTKPPNLSATEHNNVFQPVQTKSPILSSLLFSNKYTQVDLSVPMENEIIVSQIEPRWETVEPEDNQNAFSEYEVMEVKGEIDIEEECILGA